MKIENNMIFNANNNNKMILIKSLGGVLYDSFKLVYFYLNEGDKGYMR